MKKKDLKASMRSVAARKGAETKARNKKAREQEKIKLATRAAADVDRAHAEALFIEAMEAETKAKAARQEMIEAIRAEAPMTALQAEAIAEDEKRSGGKIGRGSVVRLKTNCPYDPSEMLVQDMDRKCGALCMFFVEGENSPIQLWIQPEGLILIRNPAKLNLGDCCILRSDEKSDSPLIMTVTHVYDDGTGYVQCEWNDCGSIINRPYHKLALTRYDGK